MKLTTRTLEVQQHRGTDPKPGMVLQVEGTDSFSIVLYERYSVIK